GRELFDGSSTGVADKQIASCIKGQTHWVTDRSEICVSPCRSYFDNFSARRVRNKQIAPGIKGECISKKSADKYRFGPQGRKLVDCITAQLPAIKVPRICS